MKFTEQEKARIETAKKAAEKRAIEEIIANRPHKKGCLKHDLYKVDRDIGYVFIEATNSSSYITYGEVEKLMKKCRPQKVMSEGDPFVCFIQDGEEFWYSDIEGGLIEEASANWAAKNLKDISEIKYKL